MQETDVRMHEVIRLAHEFLQCFCLGNQINQNLLHQNLSMFLTTGVRCTSRFLRCYVSLLVNEGRPEFLDKWDMTQVGWAKRNSVWIYAQYSEILCPVPAVLFLEFSMNLLFFFCSIMYLTFSHSKITIINNYCPLFLF